MVRKTYDCLKIQSTAVNEVELEKIRNLITLEDNLHSNPAIVTREAYSEETTNLTTNLENTFVKMEKFVAGTLATDGQFNLEDFISDDPWIENTAFAVPDLTLLQSDCNDTADSVLEEVIPSPTTSSDWLGSSDELDSSFLENYIDLAAFESCSYSLNIDPVSDFMPSALLNNFLASSGQDVFQEEIPADETIVDVETVSETDSVAVVPEVLEIEMCMSPFDDGLIESPVFAAAENHLVLDIQTLSDTVVSDPILSLLLKDFENSTTLATEDKVIPTTRKRSSSEENSTTAKKPRFSMLSSSSSEDASPTLHGDAVVARREKNNEASRICRASRKAKHHELFEREKELISENKELTIRVEELSNMVDFCRNYLVQKLSGKSS